MTFFWRPLVLTFACISAFGCASSTGPAAEASDDVTAAEQVIPGILARCTIAHAGAGETETGTVTCTQAMSDAFPLKLRLRAAVKGANFESRGADVTREAAGSVQFFTQGAYPLELTFTAANEGSSVPLDEVHQLDLENDLQTNTLEHSFTITGPTEEAFVVRLPYDYWPLTIRSTVGAELDMNRQLDISPWASKAGSQASLGGTAAIVRPNEPLKIFALAPLGAETLEARFQIHDGDAIRAVFDGPGTYTLGATGLVRGEGDTGPTDVLATNLGDIPETFLACQLGPDTLDGQRVFCTSRAVPDVEMQLISIELVNADGRTSSFSPRGSGTAEVGRCVKKPCSMTADVMVTAIGGKTDSIIGKATISLAEASADQPARVRLPFDLWTVHLDKRDKKVIQFSVDSESSAFPPEWTIDGLLGSASLPSDATRLTFPVAIGVTSLPAKMKSIDAGPPPKVVDAPAFTVTRGGSYRVTDSFGVELVSR